MKFSVPKCAAYPILTLLLFSLVGFTWGMPARWNPDSLVLHIVEMREAGSLEPHNYKYPGLYVYTLYALTRPFSGDGLITATFVIARLLNILWGIALMLATYRIGKRYSETVAQYSAFAIAVTMGVINYTHIEVLDIPSLAFLAWSMALLLERKRHSGILLFAIAVAIKQSTILFLPGFAIVLWLQERNLRTTLRYTALTAGACIALFALTSPYHIVNLSTFLGKMGELRENFGGNYKGLTGYLGFVTHPYNIWNMLGPALFLAFLVGGYIAIKKEQKTDYELAALILPFLLLQCFYRMTPMRYVLPLAPLFAVIAMRGVAELRWRRVVFPLIIAASLMWTAIGVYGFANDSRYAAAEWITANIPPDRIIDILSGSYLPNSICRDCYYGEEDPAAPKYLELRYLRSIYFLHETRYQGYRYDYLTRYYFTYGLGAEYLVISEYSYCRYLGDISCPGMSNAASYPKITAMYQQLLRGELRYEKVAEFDTLPKHWLIPGPELVDPKITVFRRIDAEREQFLKELAGEELIVYYALGGTPPTNRTPEVPLKENTTFRT